MDDGGLVVRGNVRGQPGDQALERRDRAGLRGLPLAGPAVDLAGEVVAGPAEALEADRPPVDPVQARQHVVHRIVHLRALGRDDAGDRGIVEHAAIQRRHDVEQGADHRPVGADMEHLRHRHVGRGQRLHDPVLAVDRMCRRQQLARRLLAQDHGPVRKVQPIGRIGLAAADPLDPHRPAQPRHPAREIGAKPRRVEIELSRRHRIPCSEPIADHRSPITDHRSPRLPALARRHQSRVPLAPAASVRGRPGNRLRVEETARSS